MTFHFRPAAVVWICLWIPTVSALTLGAESAGLLGQRIFVSLAGLRRQGDRLEGRLSTIVGPVQYTYTVKATVEKDELAGTFTGDYGIAGATEVTG